MVDLRGLKHMSNTTPFSGFSEKVRSMAATSLFLLTQDLVGMGPIQMDVLLMALLQIPLFTLVRAKL